MKTSLTALFCCCLAILISSCSTGPQSGGSDRQVAVTPFNCLAVLPSRTVAEDGMSVSSKQKQTLREGAGFADTILAEELSGREYVKMLYPADIDSLNRDTISGLVGTIDKIGRDMKCEGVLVTTMRRYKQREGGAYAVDSPASASFDIQIFNALDKTIVWAADFDETQESFLSNIFSFDKAQQRGFKWITVEDLVTQGLRERLAECPYIQP